MIKAFNRHRILEQEIEILNHDLKPFEDMLSNKNTLDNLVKLDIYTCLKEIINFPKVNLKDYAELNKYLIDREIQDRASLTRPFHSNPQYYSELYADPLKNICAKVFFSLMHKKNIKLDPASCLAIFAEAWDLETAFLLAGTFGFMNSFSTAKKFPVEV